MFDHELVDHRDAEVFRVRSVPIGRIRDVCEQ